jgi:hypothetical protein
MDFGNGKILNIPIPKSICYHIIYVSEKKLYRFISIILIKYCMMKSYAIYFCVSANAAGGLPVPYRDLGII